MLTESTTTIKKTRNQRYSVKPDDTVYKDTTQESLTADINEANEALRTVRYRYGRHKVRFVQLTCVYSCLFGYQISVVDRESQKFINLVACSKTLSDAKLRLVTFANLNGLKVSFK